MRIVLTAVALAGALVASTASADTRATQQKNLERFEKYAGDPIDEFDFWSLYKWQLVGPEKVVVWSSINDAYLISVAKPCPGLEFAPGIGVTSKQRRIVSRKFDYVTYGNGRCQIMEIRPIDYKQMLKDGPEEK
ncbi:MAG TPA: DUF6491 family protein [Rhodanobacteraceae bacterium]|nr:DUF6491 family protein [Rhodanobacteraceae bacterium]